MTNTNPQTLLLQATACCSFCGALTTALLVFLPNPVAADFDSGIELYQNTLYINKLWILFIHPQLNFLAHMGIAFLLIRKHPLPIIFGSFFLLIWSNTELSQQALLIDGLNQIWRPAYHSALNDQTRTLYETLIRGAYGITDSQYFVVIYGFALGSLCYGFALIRQDQLGKLIGISLLFIGTLSLLSFIRYYMQITQLNDLIDWTYKWIYSYLQPLVRIGIGLWLLRASRKKINRSAQVL